MCGLLATLLILAIYFCGEFDILACSSPRARSSTNWSYCKGNHVSPAIKPLGIQISTSQSCVSACKKVDGVSAWLMNGVAAAFFMSLERCSCIHIDTKDDADDNQLLAPDSRR
ncbi:hypothetical protein QQP08_000841 [Theobroma cacao]|uniref:Uncharacterized protein n=1 Tax=Theobroma cacao TaxID=3641 RepID=A0A061DH93_THECC|nr:Uncharacterized protein TCM_000834 [Theobroma cacao]WRX08354.1 hypothetical protein QQP08_000841 [Theobroma cacao]